MTGMFETLFALVLILAPPGSPTPSDDVCLAFQEPLHNAAKFLEIDNNDYVFWVDTLRERYAESRTFPPLSDVHLFGLPREHCMDARAHICVAKRGIEQGQKVGAIRDEAASALLNDLNLRYRAWDYLADCQHDSYTQVVRRNWLAELRTILGDEAYYSGHMPTPLP